MPVLPDSLAPPRRAVPNTSIDAGASDDAAGPSQFHNDSPRARDASTRDEHARTTGEIPAWLEPPLPNGAKRTYLTNGGSAVVAVVFLVFVAILLGYFSSAMSWAPW